VEHGRDTTIAMPVGLASTLHPLLPNSLPKWGGRFAARGNEGNEGNELGTRGGQIF
jgi:hypothetical protein